MDFDMISRMRVEKLKRYLRVRDLKVSGRKELVARVFAAQENNVWPSKSAQEVEMEVKKEYKDKLLGNGYAIPDPFCLEGWLSEDDGIYLWPSILYPDICNYLAFNPAELASKDLSDYKNQKHILISLMAGLAQYFIMISMNPPYIVS